MKSSGIVELAKLIDYAVSKLDGTSCDTMTAINSTHLLSMCGYLEEQYAYRTDRSHITETGIHADSLMPFSELYNLIDNPVDLVIIPSDSPPVRMSTSLTMITFDPEVMFRFINYGPGLLLSDYGTFWYVLKSNMYTVVTHQVYQLDDLAGLRNGVFWINYNRDKETNLCQNHDIVEYIGKVNLQDSNDSARIFSVSESDDPAMPVGLQIVFSDSSYGTNWILRDI